MAPDATSPDLLEPVHPRDGVWLQDSPQNLMVINSVLTFDRMDVQDLRRVFRERILDLDGGTRYPRFKRRVVQHGKRWFWQDVDSFHLEDHIFVVDDPALGTREGLQEYIGRQASKTLPDDRPPWQLQFIPEFGDGGSAFVCRIHHVMGDGMAFLPVMFSLFDLDDQEQPKTRGTQGSLWKVGLAAALVGPPLLGARAVRPSDRSRLHGQALSGEKQVAWTPTIDLARIKAAKNALGATVNDLLMTVVAGGLRRYAERHPGETLDSFRVSMPVNIRSPDEPSTMDNRFGAVLFELPSGIDDPRERLTEIQRRTEKLKRSPEPWVYYGSIKVLLAILPTSVGRALVDFYAGKCTAVMSNVPGPQQPFRLAGRPVRGMLFWVPQRANIGLGISIMSFAGELRIGILADTATISDPQELVADMETELAAVEALVAS
ncbi:MAG: WS/DGAT domain-containing protein [Acidobacteriota bacterium]